MLPTERRRRRRACAGRRRRKTRGLVTPPNSVDVTAPCGRSAALASHRAGSLEPTRRRRASAAPRARRCCDRAPPTSSCVRRSRRRKTRGSRDPAEFRRRHRALRPFCCSASHRAGSLEPTRRRRASAAPRARRCCDRAPPTSSCVRRSRRRKTRGSRDPAEFRRRHRALRPFCCSRQPPRRLSRADTATASERRAASTSSLRPSAADLVVRAPVSSSANARSRDPAEFRRRPRAPCGRPAASASHRAGSLSRHGDGERAPRREHVVAATERRRPRRACAGLVVGKRAGLVTPPNSADVTAPCGRSAALPATAPALLSRHGDGERAPRREHVVAATERRRPRRACAGLVVGKRAGLVTPPNSADVTAPCGRSAALPATAPAL